MPDFNFNQVLIVLLLILLVGLFVAQFLSNRQHAKDKNDLIKIFQTTLDQMQTNPLYTQMAQGLAESVPQKTFNDLYIKAEGLEQAVGTNTPVGLLLTRVENYFKAIDSDPGNDPNSSAAPFRIRNTPQSALDQSIDTTVGQG